MKLGFKPTCFWSYGLNHFELYHITSFITLSVKVNTPGIWSLYLYQSGFCSLANIFFLHVTKIIPVIFWIWLSLAYENHWAHFLTLFSNFILMVWNWSCRSIYTMKISALYTLRLLLPLSQLVVFNRIPLAKTHLSRFFKSIFFTILTLTIFLCC